MIITSITKQERRDCYNIFVDDVFRVAVDTGVLAVSGLAEGQDITDQQLSELADQDLPVKAYAKAIDLLARRQHSMHELRRKLLEKFPAATVASTLSRLLEQNYLNDTRFAERWVTLRGGTRGPAKLRQELRVKGISDLIISSVLTEQQSDVDTVYALAEQRWRRFGQPADWQRTKPKLARYLASRGYDFDLIRQSLERLEHEQLTALR